MEVFYVLLLVCSSGACDYLDDGDELATSDEYLCNEENGDAPVDGDCHMFVRCISGKPVLMTCPLGLHFNTFTHSCDLATTEGCEHKCSDQDGFFPYPGNCSRYIYCKSGAAEYRTCDIGLHYDRITQRCEVPEKANCYLKCPKPDGNFPVRGNCQSYISCLNGVPSIRHCENGLRFNVVARQCDDPVNAICGPIMWTMGAVSVASTLPADLLARPDPIRAENLNRNTGLELDPTWLVIVIRQRGCCRHDTRLVHIYTRNIHIQIHINKCVEENGSFPVPGDCSTYTLCERGIPVLKWCPKGLHFSPATRNCQTPETAQCEFKCPRRYGRFPLLGNCKMYMECQKGNAYPRKCPSGLYFNYLMDNCDTPDNVVCAHECPKSDGIFPLPGLCNFYMICTNGIPSLKSCPKGLHFNPLHRQCDWPKNAGCQIKKKTRLETEISSRYTISSLPFRILMLQTLECMNHFLSWKECDGQDGYFPLRGTCNQYVRCRNNYPEVRHCPGSLYWNPLLQHCDQPSNTICRLECPARFGLFPLPGMCENFILCVNQEATMRRCPSGLHFNKKFETCDFPENVKCTLDCPQPTGLFRIEEYCSIYLRCVNNKQTILSCRDGLHFNHVTGRCDLPENAHCLSECEAPFGRFPIHEQPSSFLQCLAGNRTTKTCSDGLMYNEDTETCDRALIREKRQRNMSLSTWKDPTKLRFPIPHCLSCN